MPKLVIGPEGFVDLRRNPPPTRVQVQGGLEMPEPQQSVEVVQEPPTEPKEEPLPAIQKTTEGLDVMVAPPVTVPKGRVAPKLMRIESVDGPPCYAIVSKSQFNKLGRWQWSGTRSGHMYRKIKVGGGPDIIEWLHRSACSCNRADRFVAFLDGDERNCVRSNLKVVWSKEEAKEIRRQALERSAHGPTT